MAIQPPWAQILELHHLRQGAAYLKGATDTLEQLAESRDQGYHGALAGLETTLAFNRSGACPALDLLAEPAARRR